MAIEPFIQSMYHLRLIRKDKVLDRWCSFQRRDFTFNIHAIRQALKNYPETEKSVIVKAAELGEIIAQEGVREGEWKLKYLTTDVAGWRLYAGAAKD